MKKLKKFYDVIVSVIVILALIVAMLVAGVRLFGVTPFTVLSGSMEPKYHVGSVIYVVPANADELEVGDAITFTHDNGVVVTHEIVEVDEDEQGLFFVTQGLANNTPDGIPVREGDVIGKATFSIPYLGYLADYLKTPYVRYVFIGVIVILILLSFLRPSDDGENGQEQTE